MVTSLGLARMVRMMKSAAGSGCALICANLLYGGGSGSSSSRLPASFAKHAQISFVSERPRAEHLVAHLRFGLGVEQRFLRAHEHRHFRAAHEFQQAQRVGGFLLGPHVAGHGANSEQIDIVRLQQHQRGDVSVESGPRWS